MKIIEQRFNKINYHYANIYIYIISISTLLPLGGVWYYIRFLIPFLYLIIQIFKKELKFRKEIIIFILLWGICLFGSKSVIVEESFKHNDDVFFHEIKRFFLYVICILAIQNKNIKFKHLRNSCYILTIFHFCVQLLQWSKNEWIFEFIKTKYLIYGGSERHLSLAYNDSIVNFRSGSIYINPNVLVPMIMFLLVVMLESYRLSENKKTKIVNLIMMVLSLISIFFCGSRTGFIGTSLIVLWYIYKYAKKINKKNIISRYIFLIIGIFMFYLIIQSGARMFEVSAGLDDSMGHKLNGLQEYIIMTNPISFIIGNNINMGSPYSFDFEWAYIFCYFGIIGIIMYTRIHKILLEKSKLTQIDMKFLYQGILIVLIVESLTATVLFNAAVFYFFILTIFSRSIQNN